MVTISVCVVGGAGMAQQQTEKLMPLGCCSHRHRAGSRLAAWHHSSFVAGSHLHRCGNKPYTPHGILGVSRCARSGSFVCKGDAHARD